MLLADERELVADYGKKLVESGLTRGTGGNLSIYNRTAGLAAVSPSGIDYFAVTPEDVPVVNAGRETVAGKCRPSSELDMHMIFYEKRDDVCAVVHTHSVFATTISCLRRGIPPVHYLLGTAGGSVPCAGYATVATAELAEAVFAAMGDRKAVLLPNHGLLAVGRDISDAFNTADITEFCAEVYYRAQCIGDPVMIPDEEMDRILQKFRQYGA